MDTISVFQLTREIENQYALFLEIHDITLALNELCKKADFSEPDSLNSLDNFIALRKARMLEIENSRKKISGILKTLAENIPVSSWTEIAQSPSLPVTVTNKLKEIPPLLSSLLQEIASLDEENQQLLQQRMQTLKKEALTLQQGIQARRAYHPVGHQLEGVFIDHKKI